METKEVIKSALGARLPGRSAHLLMAPANRFADGNDVPAPDARNSSVMLLLYERDGELYLPLIKRPLYNGVHGGQMSFPGGKWEESDNGAWEAAVRETREEIGVEGPIEKIAHLTPLYIPHSRYMVYPFVGYLSREPVFYPDSFEVEQVVEVPLAMLQMPQSLGSFWAVSGDVAFEAPCFQIKGHCIWGATAMILSELIEMVRPFAGDLNAS